MSNLQRLYESRGDSERAALLGRAVERHRNQNPYYRYQLARQAFDDGDYDTAIRHLRFAIRKKDTEDRFFFLLGMSYLRRGNPRLAREYLDRAQKVAATESLKRGYSSKIEKLLADLQ
jgi:Flp pilus assembly protein TadD